MKKLTKISLIAIAVLVFLALVIKVDKPLPEEKIKEKHSISTAFDYHIKEPVTVTVDGVDYLQTQVPLGKFGGQMVQSTIGEGPKTFNPWTSKDAFSSTVSGYMFDGLVATSPYTGLSTPRLAKSVKVLDDKKTYIVELRRGIKWSDGVEITADDVVYTWDTIIFGGFGNTSTRDGLVIDGKLPTVKKLDKYTVKFVTPKPYAPFLLNLSTPIAPKHIFKPVTDKGLSEFDSFWSTNVNVKNLVASGPYIITEYIPAQRVVFKRNPNYYVVNTENKQLPYLDKLIILIVGDLNNELLKFKAGETDVIGVKGSDIALFKEREKNSDYKMYNLGPSTGTMFLSFNLNNRKDEKGKYYVNPIKQKWFNDINFRTAVDYAIDRENMIFNIANGAAEPLFTAEALPSIYLNKNIAKGHPRDLEYAKTLLKKSEFTWNNKGQLQDKDGNSVEFDLFTNAGNNERESIGVMIKQDLEDLGMKVNFKPIEFNNLVNKISNSLDFDTVIIGLTGSTNEPNSGKNVWQSFGVLHIFNKRFERDKANPQLLDWEKEIDRIFDAGALELTFAKRKKYYDKYQQIIYDQRPLLYLYSPLQINAIRKKFGNVFPTPLGGMVHNMEEIYIHQQEKAHASP